MSAEPEPMEQIDYGGVYRSYQSPQQNLNLNIDGGTLAIAISLLALGGVLVAAILLPQLMDKQAEAAALRISQPIATQAAEARSVSYIGERQSKIATEELRLLQVELAKQGTFVRMDGH